MSTRSLFALAALALAACNPASSPGEPVQPEVLPLGDQALSNARHATGSNMLATDAGGLLFAVNPDSGTLTRVDPITRATTEVDVGTEPSRVTVAGDRVFVSLRGERALVRLDADTLEHEARAEIGAEPVGVVAREDGRRVYVALSQENAVLELDGETLAEVRRFEVSGEPRYLGLHPSGGALYVGSGRGVARLTRVDLQTGAHTDLKIPDTRRFGTEAEIELVPRLTGDLWVTPSGDKLLVPVLYSDNTTPIADLAEVQPGGEITPQEPGVEGYGGGGDGVDKFNASVVELPLGPAGEVDDTAARALFVSTTVFPPNGTSRAIGSYITGVTSSPDGQTWMATMEASRAAVLIDPDSEVFTGMLELDAMPEMPDDVGPGAMPFTLPEEAGFVVPALATLVVGEGANGAVFAGDGSAFVRDGFEDTVSEVDLTAGRAILERAAGAMMNMGEFSPRGQTFPISTSPLPEQVKQGRSLFFSATERSMGSGGISCSTCHYEGRNDGITWTFESGPRQTPSLAGRVSETAPVTWTNDVNTVADEADLTTRGRMGGEGLDPAQLAAVAAFVDWTRLPDTPDQGRVTPAVARGREIFQRGDVGCASCHAGERLTDNTGHDIRGIANLNTPGLQGVAGTAPYLHDGSLATLRDVLEWARTGQMGDTSSLSDSEMDDLEAYLKSL